MNDSAPADRERQHGSRSGKPSSLAWLIIIAAMAVVTAKLMDAPPLGSANDRSRWCTVWSLVERDTYQIDEIRQRRGWDTIDLVRHDGHFYSSKPPLLPWLVAGVYSVAKAITGRTLTSDTAAMVHWILFLINVIPMAIALKEFDNILVRYCDHGFSRRFLLVSACFAIPLLPFLTVFNNHTVAAICFMLAIAQAIRILNRKKKEPWRFILCGVLTAFGVCNELPAAAFGVILTVLLLRAAPKQTLIWYVPAACVPLIAFFWTLYDATGGFIPFYAFYGTEKYEFVHEGVPSYWMDPKGIDRPRDSPLTYLLHCTFGHHGIFSLTPIFLLTVAGWMMPVTWKKFSLKSMSLSGLALTVIVLGFYLSKTENYNYGGVSVALRWMLWLSPFWLLAMIPVLDTFSEKKWFRLLSVALLSLSVFSAWFPWNGPWKHPWLFVWMERRGWIDYSDPRPQLDRPHYSWISRLPIGPQQPEWHVRFESVDTRGHRDAVELQDAGPADGNVRKLNVRQFEQGEPVSDVTYHIDVAAFDAGRPVDAFLIGRDDGVALTDEDRTFFRGLPESKQYYSSRIRYTKTPLRTDAFECHVAYGYVSLNEPDRPELQQIRDVWYCDEVPFGVLQWQDRTIEASNGDLVARRHWTAVEAGTIAETESQEAE